ncbi:MAG: argininosuccinate synthase, partial [bacterium]|nr:argininosuccinate synthase [bacterium]
RGIEIPVTKEAAYSLDKNLWGCSISCGPVEDLSFATHEEMYELTRSLEDAPDQPQIVEIYFEKGIPCKINGKEYGPIELMVELNRLAGENGIGRIDMVENRVVGIKSREVYECPGSIALHVAHSELESLTIDHETLKFKKMISPRYSELVYCGHWFSPLKIAFDAFIDSTQENVTGSIKMKFYKGNCTVIGRESKYSLYDYELSTYSLGDRFDHHAGKGFTQIFGLQLKTMSEVRKKVSG